MFFSISNTKIIMIIKSILRIFILTIIFNACAEYEEKETGTVSFGTNTDLWNCYVTPKIYVDNVEMGIVPGYIDSIRNCSSDSTLNIDLAIGHHTYKFVTADNLSSCRKVIKGEFYLEKDECKRIYINANE